jgi:predicted PurR-regulated permease PerM
VPGEEIKLPFYAKVTIFLVGTIALTAILYIGRSIIVPLLFATIIAIMLTPVVRFFVKLKINRLVAIAFVMLLTLLVILAFISLMISQVSRFSDSWPILVEKFTGIVNQNISDAASYYDKDPQKIHDWISKAQGEFIQKGTSAIGPTLVIAGNALIVIFLLPVYIFLILFYQPILMEFIHRLFGSGNHSQVTEIVGQIENVIQRYLFGLVIEAIIIAALDTLALVFLGIEYALIIGILGALLNMIPYLGGLIAVAIPMMVALVTKSSPMYALYVMLAYYVIQLFDNNFVVPKIVASKVKINALFSIAVVIAGNALWGITGMFISIPLLAIIKLVCDHVESLKPFGFLLGDTMPPILKINKIFKTSKTSVK